MKKIIYLLLVIFPLSLFAQTLNSLYFLDNWSLSHTSNAALAPKHGYVSIPFMGSSQFSISSNLGLSNVVFPYQNTTATPAQNELVTFMHPSVNTDQFLGGISENNFFSQESNNNFIAFGFYGKNSEFWSFSMSLREQFNLNVPYGLFHLAKVGMKGNGQNHYDLRNLYLKNTYFGELYIGYSRDIDDKLRLGGKVKLLAGLVSTNISFSQFDIDLSQQEWRAKAKGELMLNSRTFRFNKDQDGYLKFDDYSFDIKSFKPSGYGISIDFGGIYKPVEGLTLGLNLSDLGFITWRKTSWQRGVSDGDFTFNGFTHVDLTNIDLNNQFETLKENAQSLVKFKEDAGSDEYKLQELPAAWNVSAEYSLFHNQYYESETMGERDVLAGLLWNSRYLENKIFTELMGAISVKPFSWMKSSITYTLLSNRPKTMGFAVVFSPSWINLFVASDGINTRLSKQFIPIDPFYTSIQAGITIPLSKNVKYKERNQTDYYHRED